MKTTIELPDALAGEAKALASAQGTTLRELVVEGLRREVASRSSAGPPVEFDLPTASGSGMRPDISLSRAIELTYGLPALDQ